MSAQHTPGPWILATVPTSAGSCHKIGAFPTGNATRPYTYACVYADGIRPGIDDSNPVALELAANARLIAAAPELLAALQRAEACLGLYGAPSAEGAAKQARAAIAKATGSAK